MSAIFLKLLLPSMFSGHIPLARWNVIVWVIVVCLQAGTISSRGVQFHFHGHQGNVGQFSLATIALLFLVFMHSAYCSLWCVLRHSSWLSSLALNQSWWWSTLKNKPFTFCQTCPGNFSTHAGTWANTDLGSAWFALHAIHRVRIYSSGSMKTQLYKIQSFISLFIRSV